VAKLAKHDVERGVRIGQRFGIAFDKVDIDACDTRVVAGAFKQRRRQIKSRYARATASRGDRDNAGSASDVEHALSFAHLRKIHQLCGRHGRVNFHRRKYRPAFALGSLEPRKRISSAGHNPSGSIARHPNMALE
jgi:hypothetical protein